MKVLIIATRRFIYLLSLFLCITCAGIKFTPNSTDEMSLPKDYTQRCFLKGLASLRNEPQILTGGLVIALGDTLKRHQFLGRFVKNNYVPPTIIIEEAPLYCGNLTISADANGSYMICNLKATLDNAYELIIKDNFYANLADSFLLLDNIIAFGKEFPDSIIDKISLVTGVKHTIISYKIFKKISANTTLSGGNVFGAGGNVFYSTDMFMNDYVVSADITPLRWIITGGSMTKARDTLRIKSLLPKGFEFKKDFLVNFKTPEKMSLKELRTLGYKGKDEIILPLDVPNLKSLDFK